MAIQIPEPRKLSLRRGASPVIAAVGVLSLNGFAAAPRRIEIFFEGGAYAAFGAGIAITGAWSSFA